ncbi:O-antigen translocase [Deferribacterales bacterium Es71-Z0220]|uniref:O-antigen translocase n=1 Tax=Deferrivibrio essentukiensis TaxID=2880922 RepID=UPI001F6103EF|nr:O-antigen translocase [Deferrivibrio essentukiensis]MCB4205440.1 O-antigen translocase [Deferrivibrio essentukiensis]
MTLIKTSILSAISTAIKVIAGFVSVKVVAVYIGPSGLALMGQMQNFIAMMSSIASAGVNSGVVKYTAEHYEDDETKRKIWSSALKISLVLIMPMAIAIIFLADFISLKLLNTTEYSSIFIIFAVTIIFFVFNGLLTSILNGQKEIKKLTILNITSSFFGLAVTILLVSRYKLYGALIAGIISQSIVFFVTLAFVLKSNWFKLSMFFGSMDKEYRNKLLKYSLMSLVSATMIPLSHMYVRDYIGTHIGWDEAGYWQAIWRISETYLMLITTTLSIYYLPKLSSIKDKRELKRELLYGYKIVMPIVTVMALGIYLFRDFIIQILFTKEFLSMADLFLYQLIGDVIKIAAWLLGYIMVAKAMTKLFIVSEIFFVWSFVGFVVLFVNMYGLVGVTMAFMINYFIYLIFLYFSLRGYLNGK